MFLPFMPDGLIMKKTDQVAFHDYWLTSAEAAVGWIMVEYALSNPDEQPTPKELMRQMTA
jgi:hypothetical protein